MDELSPSQFIAARALASAYNHLWSGVPDETYDLEDIIAWSEQHQHPMLPGGGIYAPNLVENGGWKEVVHTTGSGRLRWTVNISGNVTLNIYRPPDLSPTHASFARTMAYAAIQAVEPPDTNGVLVASVTVLNGPECGDIEKFSVGTIEIGSSSFEKTHEAVEGYSRPQVKHGWNYFQDGLRDDLLFERHVGALIRPLVALLTANEQEPDREEVPDYDWERTQVDPEYAAFCQRVAERNHSRYQEWRQRVIYPAIERAKEVLAPLFAIALPDPECEDITTDQGGNPVPLPETYWTRREVNEVIRQDEHNLFSVGHFQLYEVVHRGEHFPVETERAAVHMTLALQANPKLPMIDALKSANRSRSYRPDPTSELYRY